jgi:hypothetical protein
MKIEKHIIASAGVSGIIFAATGSAKIAGAALITGIFIDVDHLYDYWKDHSFDLNLSKFFKACFECDFKKTRLLLHSVEFLLIIAIASFLMRSWLLAGFTLGMCQHLMFDQITNLVYPASYSFIYRWLNGFKAEKTFKYMQTNRQKYGNN